MPAARQVSSLLTPNTHGAKTVTGPSFQTRKPGVRVAPVTPWKVAEPGRPPRGVPWAPPPRNRGLAWKEKGHFRPPGSGPPPATVPGVPGATERSLRAGRWQPLSTEAEAEPRPGLSPPTPLLARPPRGHSVPFRLRSLPPGAQTSPSSEGPPPTLPRLGKETDFAQTPEENLRVLPAVPDGGTPRKARRAFELTASQERKVHTE